MPLVGTVCSQQIESSNIDHDDVDNFVTKYRLN